MHHNPKDDVVAYRAWAGQVSAGVCQIINGQRIIPVPSQLDLCRCLNLLAGEDPLPFDWDIDMYTNPPALKPPRLATASVGSQPGDKVHNECENSDDDDEGLDAVARPLWTIGEVHVVKLPAPPHWTMARFCKNFVA